ncbi:MAG TPA: acyl-CoA dehydrogenase family protein [Rhizomicrobium sp.]|jgi:alkylation response protein AidB-like acyl-CoA dehydrogenase|nr:acyl-CoA dehydrogenase family protein [Rhizomicrobium sp.]
MQQALMDRVAPWLDKVAAVAPIARETANWSEAHARPHDAFVDALREAGLFSLLVPENMGGAGLSAWELPPVFEAMARVDGSAGWTLALGQGLLAQLVLPAVYRDLFADPKMTMAGSLNPVQVRATKVPGGYRFFGRGTNVSGCTHATWMVAAGLVVEDGVPKFVDNMPIIRVGVLPMKDCTIHETWNTHGMRGTGSHDVTFEDFFVADDLTFTQTEALMNLGASLAPVALGIAQHAIDAFVDLATNKVPLGSRTLLRERPQAQIQLGEALGYLEAARSLFYETAAEAEARRKAGTTPTDAERARVSLGSVVAAQHSARAVDLIYDAAGLTAAQNTNPIGRCWRDIHTTRQHIRLATTRYEVYGRIALGLPAGSPLI